MSALLLDTTFLIDCERGRADLESMIDDDDTAAIAAVTAAAQSEADLEGNRSWQSGLGGCGFFSGLEGRVPGVLHRLSHEQRRLVL